MSTDRIICVERWPDIPGHSGGLLIWSGRRRNMNAAGTYWEVRRNWSIKWKWLPVKALFSELQEVQRND